MASTAIPTIPTEERSAIVAVTYADVGNIVLVGPAATPLQTIRVDSPIHVAWSADGCYLLVTVTSGEGIRLLKVDLAGNILQELFVGGHNADGDWQTWPALSPSGEWVAYVVWSGEMYRAGAEFQDVQVVAVDRRTEPFRLTERGGAWARGAVWSPDGSHLAYSDFDETGVAQVFHSRPDGSDRHQLTAFTTSGLRIGAIKWSPDGLDLAFATYYGDNLGGLWIVSLDGADLRPMDMDNSSPVHEDGLLWSENGETLVVNTLGHSSADGLYWFDVNTGEVLYALSASETPYRGIAFPFPIADVQTMGFVAGDNNFYQYDLLSRSIDLWANQEAFSYGLLQQTSPAPDGVVDLEICFQR